jgi:hypothetical protein
MCRPGVGAANPLFSLWRAIRKSVEHSDVPQLQQVEQKAVGRQSFFYSFIAILPSESGVTLDYCTIFPYTLSVSFRHFTFTPTNVILRSSYPQKVVYFHFQTFVMWLRENYDYRNVSWEMICIYDLTMSKMRSGECNTCSFRSVYFIVYSLRDN